MRPAPQRHAFHWPQPITLGYLHRLARTALLLALLSFAPRTGASDYARIYKVLPHFLDRQGRHALSPSLYERDAYQAHLRLHTNEISAVRFDVRWRAKTASPSLKLVLELRVANAKSGQPIVLERPIQKPKRSVQWSQLVLDAEAWRQAGTLIAWRASLLDGTNQLAELKSFLW